MTEQFANNATTTLNGGITSSATSLTVTSASAFPSSAQFRIIIDTEILLVTGVSSNTFTVSRGQEGTTAISHLSGATVSQILTSGALQQFKTDTMTSAVQVGAFASRPAAGTAGRLYRTTDGNTLFIDNGTIWSPFGPTVPLITPPSASSFSIQQTGGNATLSDDAGGLFFSGISRNTGGEDSLFAAQANPGGQGAPYTLTVGFIHLPGGKAGTGGFFSYHISGIGIYNSATPQIRGLSLYTDSGGALHLQLNTKGALTSTGSAVFDVGGYPTIAGPMTWFKVQDDGTNRTWSISNDGRHYKPVTVEARATGMTTQPNFIGLYLNAYNADAAMTVLSYTLTSP